MPPMVEKSDQRDQARWQQLILLAVIQWLAMTLWFSASAVSGPLTEVWQLSGGKQPLAVVEGLLTTSSAAPDPRVEWLYRQIAQFKEVDRSVALLLLDGFSYKEIAAIVGITESNVGVKIHRIKSALAGKRAAEGAS